MSKQTRNRGSGRSGRFAEWRRLVVAVTAVVAFALANSARAEETAPKIRAVPQHLSVAQGGRLVIAIELDHGEHLHSWPGVGTKLAADIEESAIRTEMATLVEDKETDARKKAAEKAGKPDAEVKAIRVYTLPAWIAKFDGTQFPQTKAGKVPDPMGGTEQVDAPLLTGKAVGYVRFEVREDAPLGEQTIEVRAYGQSCNEATCFMPWEEVIPVKVKVVAKGTVDLAATNEPGLFTAFDAARWGSGPPMLVAAGTPSPSVPAPPVPVSLPAVVAATAPTSTGPSATFFGMSLGANVLLLALASILGGFILNLTPCVLPVIPIKVMSLTQHAKSRRHALVLGLWMAAGVVAFWFVIGLPMALISRHLDPSQYIFGIWWVCLSIGLIIAVMGLGIMGLFNLDLPQSVYMIETKADSPAGSFLFGVLTAVLGLPCFGFMAGGLLAAAATMPATSIMVIFTGLGVGMAAPYLVLSVWPQLLKFIPRTGPASQLVKEVMGVLLIAAAAYFIAAGIQVLLAEYPYLADSMVWWAAGFFIAIASLWLIIRTWQITKRTARRVAFTVLAFLMTGGIWFIAQRETSSDRATYLEHKAAMAAHGGASGDAPSGVWLEYTPELFSAVRASGKPIFLDFTAPWCITCKALKAAILDPMRPEFKSRGVVIMKVNCASPSTPGSELLRKLGRTGVPQWAIYPSKSDDPRFVAVEKVSSDSVISELEAAGILPALPKAASAANDAKSPPR